MSNFRSRRGGQLNATEQPAQTVAWLQLLHDRRWSRRQKQDLLQHFPDPAELIASPCEQLEALVGQSARGRSPADINSAAVRADLEWLRGRDCHLLTPNHTDWPRLLAEISDPPLTLFVRGNSAALTGFPIAMVGSRRPTPVGSKMAREIARELAGLGLLLVSGMALGIDAQAHCGALDAQAPTVAVLGCGVDVVYPRRNRALSERIVDQGGCLISEFPCGTPPLPRHFPQRNRIVSGLCHGVIIIEAAKRSGTLITARLGMEQDREVMVMPGPALSAQYQGSHRLIQQGAALITGTQDVLAELSAKLQIELEYCAAEQAIAPASKDIPADQSQREEVLEWVDYVATPIDQIISSCGLTAAEVSSMLQRLEVEGLVARAEDGGYVKLV